MSRRDFVTIENDNGDKVKQTKVYLTMFLNEAYGIFVEENPDKTISFSKFCELRPKNVLQLRDTPSEQCQTHENFRLALYSLGITYNKEFWSNTLCNSEVDSVCWSLMCPDCSNGTKITHLKQKTDLVNRGVWTKISSKRIQRVKELVPVHKIETELRLMWDQFVNHVRVKRMQYAHFQTDQLAQGVRIINIDFAMNLAAEGQEEIRSTLWSRASVVLFTVAIQYNQEIKFLILVSDYKAKDKNAIFAYLGYILSYLGDVENPEIREVIWSDGPSSEFKNQCMCTALKYFAKKYLKMFEWKYFATSHGKGLCDAVGGKAKMVVREKTLVRGFRIDAVNNAADFVRICQNNLPGIRTVEIKPSEIIALNSRKNLWESSSPVKGIKSAYHLCAFPDGTLTID
ncbi:uncharacterized protein LOC129729721 [Wyeomyia smithii]|uniref:uncharacterized protein LOC129729721 n=1 Tax=Wyeomyia smithii TaxID=174621 RepID=UPI002467C824|nr:uncharacterized protein LOC129729721 [Wyeomyia smithii]XP_055544491.1 uncharacterized protein LOC129729721 [Wyeomyia smithii]XP_055544497.1 uncharacterized protein LOC129729721 [Wyeomyia smithii]